MLMLLKKIRREKKDVASSYNTTRPVWSMKLSLALVLLTEVLGGVDHVGECTLDLIPVASLQTAVGVDPELIRAEVLKHLLDTLLELSLGGDTRAVDVIDTGANVTRVRLVNKDLEELGIGLGVLNGENVGIQRSDGMEEVLELRVAEVGVNLSGVLNTSSGELEAVDSPLEVGVTLRALAERKTLTKSRLVDLNDKDAVLLKVNNLVAEGQSELLALDGLVDVVTGERPPEAGDGTSKHTLHGLLGD
jgi:hypothetical protein